MVVAMRVQFDASKALSLFKSLPKHLKVEVGEGMFKIGKSYQRSLRYALNRNSERFKNKIYSGIQARKISDNQTQVIMPIEGVYLDSMRTHWVSLKRGRLITEWARSKGITAGAIQVRKHPFIEQGFIRGRESRKKILQETMDKAMAKSRK